MANLRREFAVLLAVALGASAGCPTTVKTPDVGGVDIASDVPQDTNGDIVADPGLDTIEPDGPLPDPGQDTSDVPIPDPGQPDNPDPGPVDVLDPDVPDPGTCDGCGDVPIGPETTTGCNPPCGDEQTCAGNVCISTKNCEPGFDGELLAQDLNDGATIVRNICGGGAGAFAWQPVGAQEVLELHASDELADTDLFLLKSTYTPEGLIFTLKLATTKVPGELSEGTVFPGDFLAIDPAFTKASFGYTGPFNPAVGTQPGSVFFADAAAQSVPQPLDAPANFAAASVTTMQWIVSAWGADGLNSGNGLYLVTLLAEGNYQKVYVATNNGVTGGNLAVAGNTVLVGGFADPWPSECDGTVVNDGTEAGNKVFVVSLESLYLATTDGTPVDLFCTAQEVDLPSDFRFLPDTRILAQAPWKGDYLSVYSWNINGGMFTITSVDPVTDGDAFSGGRGVPGTNRILLKHMYGYLLVEP